MTSSLALLEQPHATAVLTIIGEALKEDVTLDDLVVGQYTVRPDGKVNQPIYIDSDAYDNPDWLYRGSAEMTHERVDLHAAMGHLGLRFRLPADQYVASEIVARLSAILLLHFESTDYIHETRTINSTQVVTLKAAVDSPRWKGQVDIIVYR